MVELLDVLPQITACSLHICGPLTAGMVIHYVSVGKGCRRGSEESRHHISPSGPVREIITCADKMPQNYFLWFFFSSSSPCVKQTASGVPKDLLPGHVTLVELSLVESLSFFLPQFITVTSVQVKKKKKKTGWKTIMRFISIEWWWKAWYQRDRERDIRPFRN